MPTKVHSCRKEVQAPSTSTFKTKHFLTANNILLLPCLFLLALLSLVSVAVGQNSGPLLGDQSFTLRHIYHRGTSSFPDLHRRFDLSRATVEHASRHGADQRDKGIGPFITNSSLAKIWRPLDRRVGAIEAMLSNVRSRGVAGQPTPDSAWILSTMLSPEVTDKKTVINLALMAANAYNIDNTSPHWEDVSSPFNLSSDIGWEEDGLRGHVFADQTNSTIIISIKGTSSAIFDGAETTTNDKLNDNLFAGCCCGQGTILAKKACDCMTSTYTCNENCICEEMYKQSRYYQASIDLYSNITEMYPKADVWLTGHSLGGLVTGLLGLTFGVPVVTFESIPQALAASRLGIPAPPRSDSGIVSRHSGGLWNFGHTADPVYMGTCNGATSLCTMAGYALQSQCHAGLRCVYDVVKDFNWSVSLATHGIKQSINDVYQVYDQVPICEYDGECVDCFMWKKDYSNITKTSTISSSSRTHTRTETCKTPGWWGCRDETKTTPTPTRTSITTITITSCNSYGWFGGCLEPTTPTTTSTTAVAAATSTGNIHTIGITTGEYFSEDWDWAKFSPSHRITAHPGL